MKNNKLRWLVRTAVLVAIAIVFQMLRFVIGDAPWTTYVISSLVNLALIMAVLYNGLGSGLVVAVITPLFAFLQGHAQAPMILPVALGNASLVVLVWLFARGAKQALTNWKAYIGVILGAAVKYAIIAVGMALMLTSTKGAPFSITVGTAALAQIVQPITAVIGSLLAFIVYRLVKKAI